MVHWYQVCNCLLTLSDCLSTSQVSPLLLSISWTRRTLGSSGTVYLKLFEDLFRYVVTVLVVWIPASCHSPGLLHDAPSIVDHISLALGSVLRSGPVRSFCHFEGNWQLQLVATAEKSEQLQLDR